MKNLEFKGTKGEWEIRLGHDINGVEGDNQVVIFSDDRGKRDGQFEMVCSLSQEEHYSEEDEANAKLIASAPDLLKALQETEKDLCVLWGQMLDLEKTNPKAEGLADLIDGWRKRNKQAINKALL